MAALISGWTSAAITLFAAALFLTQYTSKTSRLYKRKWVMAACLVMVLSSVVGITSVYRSDAQGKSPSRAEVQEALSTRGTLAEKDVTYDSPDGYSVTIPSGYVYTTYPSGNVSMTAVKKQPGGQSAIVIARQRSNGEIESIVNDMTAILKKRNPTYAFSPGSQISLGDRMAMRIDVGVEKEGVPIKGVFVFTKVGNTCFELMMSCPASLFDRESPVFEKLIESTRLG
jgi:hypothetical protein